MRYSMFAIALSRSTGVLPSIFAFTSADIDQDAQFDRRAFVTFRLNY